MGLYQALVEAEPSFRKYLAPLGYASKEPKWIIELAPTSSNSCISIRRWESDSIDLPNRQRSGRPKEGTNEKPYLTADNGKYVFSINDSNNICASQFQALHQHLLLFCRSKINSSFYTLDERSETKEVVIPAIRRLLALTRIKKKTLKSRIPTNALPKERELIVFMTPTRLLADYRIVQDFWAEHLGRSCSTLDKESNKIRQGICGVTSSHKNNAEGEDRDLLRIMPFSPSLFGYPATISSVDEGKTSFESANKRQLANAAICKECGIKAVGVLSYLTRRDSEVGEDGKKRFLNSGPHCVVLAQEFGSKRPLANQLAVFWTEEDVRIETNNELDQSKTATEVIRISLDEDDDTPPEQVADTQIQPEARSSQLRNFLESPWYCKSQEIEIFDPIPFYFAILSPNKSRLAIREWIETDVSSVRNNLIVYREALEIIDPVSGETVVPALRALLEALRAPSSKNQKHNEKPRLAEIEPELTRQLVRTMYTGSNPPDALLRRAVQAFAMPDSAKGQSGRRLSRRRTALAAAMKLILTYKHPAERKIMIQQKTKNDEESGYKNKSPYLCGQIFAILGEIQRRASSSGRGVNATVVDKFYSTAATAPQSVLGNLLTKASVGHLPKLRKDPAKGFTKPKNEGGVHLADLLTQNVARLDAACGPKPQHTPRQQAEFALGYHHQLAEFRF